ncbi:MAG TPA: hypothetical protein VFO29_07210 [Candidatus Rubrimentiphilum sp.]|nr:hypothetical protein [Candidatus Rubrimentiphilum sp.]
MDATKEEGTVKEVHPHQIIVRISTPTGHEERGYAVEDLRLDPTMDEVSNFRDH